MTTPWLLLSRALASPNRRLHLLACSALDSLEWAKRWRDHARLPNASRSMMRDCALRYRSRMDVILDELSSDGGAKDGMAQTTTPFSR